MSSPLSNTSLAVTAVKLEVETCLVVTLVSKVPSFNRTWSIVAI